MFLVLQMVFECDALISLSENWTEGKKTLSALHFASFCEDISLIHGLFLCLRLGNHKNRKVNENSHQVWLPWGSGKKVGKNPQLRTTHTGVRECPTVLTSTAEKSHNCANFFQNSQPQKRNRWKSINYIAAVPCPANHNLQTRVHWTQTWSFAHSEARTQVSSL